MLLNNNCFLDTYLKREKNRKNRLNIDSVRALTKQVGMTPPWSQREFILLNKILF